MTASPTDEPGGPAPAFHLRGYDVGELLGRGSGGEVWLAREQATGDPVALKRLADPTDLVARDQLRREAAVLAGVEHPHVLRLRSVLGDGEAMVLVLDVATGGSLAGLLAARGRLSPGEIVTLAVPLGEALAAVHRQGVLHGDVTPSNVLFTSDGRPVLSDLGVSRLIGVGSTARDGTPGFVDPALDPGPAGDVHGLAATCLAALTGEAPYDESGRRRHEQVEPSPLRDALERALDPDPAHRPTADELALAVFDAVPAVPMRLASRPERVSKGSDQRSGAGSFDAAPAVTHRIVTGPLAARPTGDGRSAEPAGTQVPRHRRRRTPRWRTFLAVVLGGLAVAMAAVTGIAWAGAGNGPVPGSVQRSRPPAEAAPDWAGVMARLDARRSRAFAAGDLGGLDGVYASDSPAGARDRLLLRRLVAAGLRTRGLHLRTVSVRRGSLDADAARLLVDDTMDSYVLVDSSGRRVQQRPGRGRQTWSVTLVRSAGTWKVADIVAL